jgi:hypothetical protein
MKTYLFTICAYLLLTGISSCKQKDQAIASENMSNQEINLPDSSKTDVRTITIREDANLLESDPFRILETEIEGDILSITVSYGGGCKDHEFTMFSSGQYGKSYPPKLILFLKHVSNGDMCKALLTETLQFDLSSIQFKGSDIMHLQLNNYEEFIIYTY